MDPTAADLLYVIRNSCDRGRIEDAKTAFLSFAALLPPSDLTKAAEDLTYTIRNTGDAYRRKVACTALTAIKIIQLTR